MKERIVEIWKTHSVIGAIILTICVVVGYLAGYFSNMFF